MQEQLNFFKIALLDHHIGAITRSSKYVVNAVMRNLIGQSLRRVIEYGPGDGVITKAILNKMPRNGELIVVETNPKFLKVLKKIDDPRLKIINGTVQKVSKELINSYRANVNLILSSIPFSILKPFEREDIVSNAFNMLENSGKFIVFQYSPLMLGLLKRYSNTHIVNTQFELRNIPPMFIMSAKK